MGSTRRAFTPEYKAQSVAFVIDGGRSVAEVARNIGVHKSGNTPETRMQPGGSAFMIPRRQAVPSTGCAST